MTVRVQRGDAACAAWAARVQSDHYRKVECFDASFDAALERALAGVTGHGAPFPSLWVAMRGDTRLGCMVCTDDGDSAARLKLVYVVPEARGQGVAELLLNRVSDHAEANGCRLLRVSSFAEHGAARAFYAARGFVCAPAGSVRAFGRTLSLEHWEKPLF
ncbi:GNAT family N-acetyltransferase [Meridianimarinicoccus roseus]|uniref:GNAT family N-acetyltransferase n=1 Tax=Meridianimarinicoccus roseus TaxID=2072018 RepID=UPI0011B25E80|nr:GNAT family N-acetyltransferase [Meridianimarinicoccus roseus]